MSFDRWFGDRTDRTIEGRFLDHEIPDPANSTPYKEAKKTVTIVETRNRAAVAGPQNSTGAVLKPHNREEMTVERFPDAWAHYEATKAGKTIEAEKSTALKRNDILGIAEIQKLCLNGFSSEERFAAMTDAEAIEILGQKGPVMRDKYPGEVARVRDALKFTIPAPPSTPIKLEGPIDEFTIKLLECRGITTLEQVAGWKDDVAFTLLSGKGFEVRLFAKQKLQAIASGQSASDVAGQKSMKDAAETEDGTVIKAGRAKPSSKSSRKSSFGTPLVG